MKPLQDPLIFALALKRPALVRSAHFALHRGPQGPKPGPAAAAFDPSLSTSGEQHRNRPVDNLPAPAHAHPLAPGGLARLGLVVPKRYAPRAVTRNLIRRQARSLVLALEQGAAEPAALPAGSWVLRLKAPLDAKRFVSAHSKPLAAALRDELQPLIAAMGRQVA